MVVAPQKGHFDKAITEYKRYRGILIGAFTIAIVRSMIGACNFSSVWYNYLLDMLNLFSVLCTISIFVEERKYANKFCLAEDERRNGLLDNSFGSKYAHIDSENYYDTEELDYGNKKLLANLHESSIYTSAEANYMVNRQVLVMTMGGLLMVVCSYIGLRNISIYSSILEFFLSYLVIGRYLDLKSLSETAENVSKRANQIWVGIENGSISNLQVQVMDLLLKYETSLASAQVILSEAAYKKCSQSALEDWNTIKIRYKIRQND